MEFESLGNGCDFGMVQRTCGAEPLGLFRFAGSKIANLTSVLENALDGFLTPDADWSEGSRVYVHCGCEDEASIQRLHNVLNARRRCVLLWVVQAERADDRGCVETLGPTLLKGFIAHYGKYDHDPRLDFAGWIAVCLSARAILQGTATPRLEHRRLEAFFHWRRDVGGRIEIAGHEGRCRVDRDPGFNIAVARVIVEASFAAVERAVFSVWIRWPTACVGRDMVLTTQDAKSINARRPNWSRTNEWQQIWIVMRLHNPCDRIEIVLQADAEVGATFLLAGWQIEAGVVADESLRRCPKLPAPQLFPPRQSRPRDFGRRLRTVLASKLAGVASRLSPDEHASSAQEGDHLARVLLERADALMQARLFDDAEAVLAAAATLHPWAAEIFTHQAVCAELRGNPSEAVRRWKGVTAAFPSIALGHYRLAAALRTIGDIPAAQRVIDDALADHNDNAAMLAEAARVLGAAGRFSEAAAIWDAALGLNDGHSAWAHERAAAHDASSRA